MEQNELIEMDIADTIMERPYGFSVGDRNFYLYPLTLGKSYLLARLMKELAPDMAIVQRNPYAEALRLCAAKRPLVCRLLAYHTFDRKEELLDNRSVSERSSLFADELTDKELATLLVVVFTLGDISAFIRYLGIDKEREWYQKACRAKPSGGTLTFGGKSVYGTLIDYACQRYGWTFDNVVWGISYANLQMLMADAVTSVYLTDKERRKVHIPTDRTIVRADDPKNAERIRTMDWK